MTKKRKRPPKKKTKTPRQLRIELGAVAETLEKRFQDVIETGTKIADHYAKFLPPDDIVPLRAAVEDLKNCGEEFSEAVSEVQVDLWCREGPR